MRNNTINIIVGGRGSGKTTLVKSIIDNYKIVHLLQKILILDELDNEAYSMFPVINQNMLFRWSGSNVYRIFEGDSIETIEIVNNSLKNLLFICEDAARYIEPRIQKSVKRILINSKQINCDLIFVYHDFHDLPAALIRKANTLTLFKTESPEYRKNDLPAYPLIYETWLKVIKSKNPYEKRTIQLY